MSQIGGKMSKFWGKFDIVSKDLRIILSNFVATDVYALFKKSIKKNRNIMFKTTKLYSLIPLLKRLVDIENP